MEFAFDEAKRLANLAKHGLDFRDADLVFDGPILLSAARTVAGEPRWLAVGMIEDVHVTVVFTWREAAIRLISLRRARRHERARHHDLFCH
jgi:uncharacterized protein